ncbi:hypothetical protein FRB96_005651 [Tulasnella sp. 330]|nr:hypothetical protein FRB96_005651 [Tulasnella sp. 330]KAG8886414.1 hypothetical protein FRB97_004949 [Tulasnella sp. 331]
MSSTAFSTQGEKDCCTVPPIVTGEYIAKGEYKPFGGLKKVYITGDTTSRIAIVSVYDVFGYVPQTIQGADILAHSLGARVIMPDFFGDFGPIPQSAYPPTTDEHRATIQKWRDTVGGAETHLDEFYAISDALKAEGVTKIGAVGFCWGGKFITIAGRRADKVDALVSIHPGRVAASDAEELAVPIAMFPSQGEDAAECEAFMKGLESKPFASKNVHKRYDTMPHGWAAARANLEDKENLKEYKDVYERTATFFKGILN